MTCLGQSRRKTWTHLHHPTQRIPATASPRVPPRSQIRSAAMLALWYRGVTRRACVTTTGLGRLRPETQRVVCVLRSPISEPRVAEGVGGTLQQSILWALPARARGHIQSAVRVHGTEALSACTPTARPSGPPTLIAAGLERRTRAPPRRPEYAGRRQTWGCCPTRRETRSRGA